MKLIRYVYPPDGRIMVTDKIGPFTREKIIGNKARVSRIEIYNIHGDLVRVITDMEKAKMLKLQEGFYLLREIDLSGRIIKSSKLVL